jgi:hypothetical protein
MFELKPIRNPEIQWIRNEEMISLKVSRKGFMDKLMYKVFKTPQTLTLELDEMGSFVWKKCDGSKNVYEILQDLSEHTGEKSESGLNRLVEFIKILKNNNLIELE